MSSSHIAAMAASPPSEDGSLSQSRGATRTGPAPVLAEASVRRRRHHSRQPSGDLAERDTSALAAYVAAASMNGVGSSSAAAGAAQPRSMTQRFEWTPSYLQPTESSLRRASVGSDGSMAASVRSMRQRAASRGPAEDDDLASIASTVQWSVHRRRVKPRVLRPAVAAPVVNGDARRGNGVGAGAAAAMPAQRPQPSSSQGSVDVVVVLGGARVAAGRGGGGGGEPVAAAAARPAGGKSAAASGTAPGNAGSSPTMTTITVSDEDTGELAKSGMSVSISPMTSENHTHRKSAHGQPRRGGTGRRQSSTSEHDGTVDFEVVHDADEVDAHDEPVPRTAQPTSFDGRPASAGGAAGRGGPSPSAAAALDRRRQAGRGDASPKTVEAGARSRADSLGSNAPIPATMLYRLQTNTASPFGGDGVYAPQQLHRRASLSEAARTPGNGTAAAAAALPVATSPAPAATASHRVEEGRPSGSDYDAVRKSAGSESIDNTPISVLKQRAIREAERNARREASQPQVPRLALDELNARRERQRSSTGAASYKVARDDAASGAGGAAGANHDIETPMSDGSAVSDVTVSSMTDSAPRTDGRAHAGRSGRSRTWESGSLTIVEGKQPHPQRPSTRGSHDRAEDVRVDPSPSVSHTNGQRNESAASRPSGEATYDSRPRPSSSGAGGKADVASANGKAGSPSGGTAKGTGAGGSASGRNGASAGAAAGARGTGAARPAGPPKKDGGATNGRRGSTTSAAAAEPRRRRGFEKTNGATSSSPLPASAARNKADAKCCAVM